MVSNTSRSDVMRLRVRCGWDGMKGSFMHHPSPSQGACIAHPASVMMTAGEGCPGHSISPYLSQNTKNLIAAYTQPQSQFQPFSESVRKVIHFEQSLRSMRLIEASLRNASALRDRFSKSLASLRLRPSHANDRSTTQRLGKTSKPFAPCRIA